MDLFYWDDESTDDDFWEREGPLVTEEEVMEPWATEELEA